MKRVNVTKEMIQKWYFDERLNQIRTCLKIRCSVPTLRSRMKEYGMKARPGCRKPKRNSGKTSPLRSGG